MKKIIITLLTLVFLTSCGYSPIYSSKNFDFNLKSIINSKNDRLGSKVKKKLRVFSNNESLKIVYLKLDTQRKIITLAKDSKGDPSLFEMVVSIKLEIAYQNKNINQSFEEKFNYKANINKFALNQYEKRIEELLIDKNIERIVVYLSKI